jgi:hypothetical protein
MATYHRVSHRTRRALRAKPHGAPSLHLKPKSISASSDENTKPPEKTESANTHASGIDETKSASKSNAKRTPTTTDDYDPPTSNTEKRADAQTSFGTT